MKYQMSFSQLKKCINESAPNPKIIFAKQFKLVDKVNEDIKNAISICGEDSAYLDTSSTIVSIPRAVTPITVTIENDSTGKPIFVATWEEQDPSLVLHGNKKMDTNRVTARLYNDLDTKQWYINDDTLKDQLKYLQKCVKKAVKYFKEVTPDTDEEKWQDENND